MSTGPRPAASPAITRRAALQALAAATLLAGVGPGLVACSSDDGGDGPADLWAAVAAAARATEPKLTSARAAAELRLHLGPDAIRSPSASRRAELAHRMAEDFAAGRTTLVAGWLLSRTEVLLAVIATEAS